MEQFKHNILAGDSQHGPAGVVDFDVLRAMVAIRQSATATARALAASPSQGTVPAAPAGPETLVALFTRGSAADARIGAFGGDEAVIGQDEQHA